MIEPILKLAAGCVILLAGSWIMVRSVIGVAAQLGVSPTLAGMTLVPWARVAAPMLAATVAAIMNRPNAALGILVGTFTTSAAIPTGLACLISPARPTNPGTRLAFVSLLLVGIAVLAVIGYETAQSKVPTLTKFEGGLLIAAGLATALIILRSAINSRRGNAPLDAAFAEDAAWPVVRPGPAVWLWLFLAHAVIIGGAVLAITGARDLVDAFGLARGVISATVIGAVLSLPQLMKVFRNSILGDTGVMHVQIGSASLFGLLVGIGVCAWFEPLVLTHQHLYALLCFACTCVGVSMAAMSRSRTLSSFIGVALLAMYVWFVFGMFRMEP